MGFFVGMRKTHDKKRAPWYNLLISKGGDGLKRAFIFFCIVCFFALFAPYALGEEIPDATTFYALASSYDRRAPVYTQADLASDIAGYYCSGAAVTVLAAIDDDWVLIRTALCASSTGYMQREDLTETQDSCVSDRPRYRSTSSAWELYTEPDLHSASASYGLEGNLLLLGFTDQWWFIQAGEHTGFVPASPVWFEQTCGMYYDGLPIAYVCNPDNTDRLHLREKASANSSSLGKYYNGTIVVLLSEDDTIWQEVKIGTLEGYMKSEFLCYDFSDYANNMPTCTIQNAGEAGLHLFSEQTTSAESLGLYANGTEVTILGLTETWCHVQVNGSIGFMPLSGFGDQIRYTKYAGTHSAETTIAEITETCSLYRTATPDDDDVMTTLEPGTKIEVLQAGSPWYKVKFNALIGYVSASVVKESAYDQENP